MVLWEIMMDVPDEPFILDIISLIFLLPSSIFVSLSPTFWWVLPHIFITLIYICIFISYILVGTPSYFYYSHLYLYLYLLHFDGYLHRVLFSQLLPSPAQMEILTRWLVIQSSKWRPGEMDGSLTQLVERLELFYTWTYPSKEGPQLNMKPVFFDANS
jgi:hypothetical protein